MCRSLIVEGQFFFFQMQKGTIDVSSTLDALEKQVLVCK
jgi:hypothetical protein